MAQTETFLSELKINYLTEEQYKQAVSNNQINDNEIYMTPTSKNDGTDDTKVTQIEISSNEDYPIILAKNANGNTVTDTVNKSNSLKYNPSTAALKTGKIIVSKNYGNTLPDSGTEGELFFLLVD